MEAHALPELPYDRGALFENFADMEEVISEAVQSFFDSLPELRRDVAQAIAAADAATLERSAHALKGVVSNFYAEPSRVLALQLERMGRDDDLKQAAQVMTQLEGELDRLAEALQEFVPG